MEALSWYRAQTILKDLVPEVDLVRLVDTRQVEVERSFVKRW